MLVLISFGLVLVAIVLLVLGLLAGTGLTLIYASIASSLAAGIVLVVAKVAGRPTEEAPARPAPAPAREPEPVGAGTTASFPTPSPAETTAPVPVAAQEPSYAPTSRQPAMAAAAAGAGGAAGLGGVGEDEEEDDEDFFPIEDYDRLKVSEIVPLLPELYEDELDMVEQRERAGKGRVSILNRIAELREQPLEDEAEPQAEPELDTAAVVTPEAPVEEGDEDFFPIEDYDELNVGEILPLLPELYDDELDVVEDRERATKNRAAILNRIAELREQPLEDEAEPQAEPELDTAAVVTPEAPVEEGDEDFFPIEDYDELSVGEILPLLPELYDDELDVVEERERATKSRAVILNRIAELREEPIDEPEPEPVAPAEAPVAEDDEDFFPIEDYDELSVGEILPLLPELYDDELDVVEERERATKNRAAVLNRLAELGGEPLAAESEPVAGPAPAEDEVELEDEDFFPIEDYDDLNVGEILPLLPELYDDELDVVEERERSTKNRAAILNRIAELREEPLEGEPQLDTAVVAPAEAPVAEDDEDFFPIEDYDELRTSEVLPLLPELYDDELDVVEDRERATKNRAAVLDRLAELRLETEPEPAVGDVDDEVLEDADQEQVAPAAAFPIGNYEQLRVSQIRALLPQLSEDELAQVRRREQDGKNRSTVLAAIDRELGVAPPAPSKKAAAKKTAAKKTAAKKTAAPVKRTAAPTKKTAARGTTAKKATAAKAPTAKKAPSKKAPSKKAPSKKTAAKKATAKKTTAKKTTAKKTAAPVKRTAAPTKKTATRGTTAKKATTKKAAAKKTARRS